MHDFRRPRDRGDDDKVLRVGLDVGLRTTVFQTAARLGDLLVPKTHRLPTRLAYEPGGSPAARAALLGEAALARRDELELLHPLKDEDPRVVGDFARSLRAIIDPQGGHQLWGIVNCPQGATAEEVHRIRAIAHEIFDRTRLLDAALLMATSFGSQEVARNSVWIDVGASSVRVALVRGGTPEAGETMVVAGGGDAGARRLRDGLSRRFPDLLLGDLTLQGILERFGHVPPWQGACRLRLRFGTAEESLDIASMVRRACEPLVEDILEGVRRVVSSCPSDLVEDFLGHIVVAGGGAKMKGFGERLQAEVRREFGRTASVRIPEDPTSLVANGALRWAHFLQEEEWGIPLFSFAG